jgi:hypothetical protein
LLGESELGCGYPQDAASAEQLRKRSFVQDSAASIPGQCCSAVSLRTNSAVAGLEWVY